MKQVSSGSRKVGVLGRLWMWTADRLDRAIGWDHLPRPLGILVFAGFRNKMRRDNLIDTSQDDPAPPIPPDRLNPEGVPYRVARTCDGTFNDLGRVRTGAQHIRFGRNVPLEFTARENAQARLHGGTADLVRAREKLVLTPNPRDISNKLLARGGKFQPATGLNLLAAPWIQFEVHDWFTHGKPTGHDPWRVEVDAGDWVEAPMRIQRTLPDPYPNRDPKRRPTFRSAETHWWDASQVYGRTAEWAMQIRLRPDGRADPRGRLVLDDRTGLFSTAAQDGLDPADAGGAFWLGLGLLHVLFMKEHNSICDDLYNSYPSWSSDDLYHQARLINAALMAKIHALEWTPAILGHKTTRWGSRINWWGLQGRWSKVHFGRLSTNEVLSGIPGSPTDDHAIPYTLSEEFISVYRMHPLIPDEYTFWSLPDGEEIGQLPFAEIGALHFRKRLDDFGPASCFYSFGRSHPGVIGLHNYPEALRRFERPISGHDIAEGQIPVVDMAAIDLLRDRERGVPRYNEFRRLFGLRPARDFSDLTPDRQLAAEIKAAYGDIELVDLMVGLFAEPKPENFAISDTAFRVFILMASRRLECDRFFGSDFGPQIYTPEGIDRINRETLGSILVRHFKELEPALAGVENAFLPWNDVAAAPPSV